MIATVICVLLLLSGWTEWSRGNKAWGIVLCAFFLTDFFSLAFFEQVAVKAYDFCLIFCTVAMAYENLKIPHYFTLKNDPIAKTVVLLEIYFFVSFLITGLIGAESWTYAMKAYRYYLFFLLYFLFRNIAVEDYIRSFKLLAYISFALGILFCLQFSGIGLLKKGIDMPAYGASSIYQRLRNIPATTAFMIVSALFLAKRDGYILFTLLFWGGIVVFSQHRGVMLSLLLALPLGLYLKGFGKRIWGLSTAIFSVFLLFSPVILYRFSPRGGQTSLFEDIRNGLSVKGLKKNATKGTFSFRTAFVLERWNYMTEKPERLLCGVGTMHEDSPASGKKFHFKLGVIKKKTNRRQRIDTNDIAFISFFIRYGLVGTGIMFYLLFLLFLRYIHGKDIAAGIGITLWLYALFRVSSGDEFTPFFYCLLFVCSVITRKITLSPNSSDYENSGCNSNIQQIESA